MNNKSDPFNNNSRPDLFPKAKAVQQLTAWLDKLKEESPSLYPPSIIEFLRWLQERMTVESSALLPWINKSSTKVLIITHPKNKEPALILKSDAKSLITADSVAGKIRQLVEQAKHTYPDLCHFPVNTIKKISLKYSTKNIRE